MKAWMTGPATVKVPVKVPIAMPVKQMSSPIMTANSGTNLSITSLEYGGPNSIARIPMSANRPIYKGL